MYIARTPLQTRRAYFHSFVTWQKNWRQRSARNVRVNTKGGRAYGPAVPCVAWVLVFHPSILTSVPSQSGSVAMGDIPPVPDWMSDLAQQAGMSDSAKETAERDSRWIGEFADDLNVAIALREWDRAVELVEQGAFLFLLAIGLSHVNIGQAKLPAMPLLAAKLTPLTASLTSALLQALSYPQNHKEAVKKLIALLIRLDAGAAARTTFLAARTEAARRLVRMIRFDGHIGTYINDLSTTIFTVIKHTADWFLATFKENEVASSEWSRFDFGVSFPAHCLIGFVEWAKSQIEIFAEMFRIQVFCTDVDQSVVDEALNITHNQSRKVCLCFCC